MVAWKPVSEPITFDYGIKGDIPTINIFSIYSI